MAVQPTPPKPSDSAPQAPANAADGEARALTWEDAGIPSEHPVIVWLQSNIKLVVLSIAVALLGAAAWSGLSWMEESQRREAQSQLGDILLTTAGAERVKALEAFAPNAAAPVDMGARLALAEALVELGEHEKAAGVWAQVAETAPEPMKFTARMGQAQALSLAGKREGALNIAKQLEKDAPEAYKTAALRLKAQVAEEAGEFQEAIAAYASMMEQNPDQPSAFFRQKMAELEKRQKAKEAS